MGLELDTLKENEDTLVLFCNTTGNVWSWCYFKELLFYIKDLRGVPIHYDELVEFLSKHQKELPMSDLKRISEYYNEPENKIKEYIIFYHE